MGQAVGSTSSQTLSVVKKIPTNKWYTVQDTLVGQVTHYCNLAGTGTGPVLCPVLGPALGLWPFSSSQPALLPSAA